MWLFTAFGVRAPEERSPEERCPEPNQRPTYELRHAAQLAELGLR